MTLGSSSGVFAASFFLSFPNTMKARKRGKTLTIRFDNSEADQKAARGIIDTLFRSSQTDRQSIRTAMNNLTENQPTTEAESNGDTNSSES